MADLDDFFAKKDKKKAKAKPKFLTAEEIVKKLEREAAAAKPKKPEPSATTPAAIAAPGALDDGKQKVAFATATTTAATAESNQEEEWDEFVQEQRKDYTGLKIGQLTVNDDDEESLGEGDDEDGDSEGNANSESHGNIRRGVGGGSNGGGVGGPWKKVIPAEEVTQIPMEVPKPPSSKVYISPALRQAQLAGNSMAPSRLKARNRAAPDITNADYFPTLGAARPEEQRKKKNEPAFEEVRHGGRMQRLQPAAVAAPANATNRFQSLDEDDS